MLANIILCLICLCMLCFFQGVRIAFLYSFIYRDREVKSELLTEKIIEGFYHEPGIMLLSMCVASLIFLLLGAWLEYLCLNAFCLFSATWLHVVTVRVLILLSCLIFGFIVPRQLCGRRPDAALK